ncbi:MAG: hypothetical protein ACRD2M_09615 [Terriglobales bacterium]
MALVGVHQIASALDVTRRRINQLVHLGLPREGHGQYDLGKCMAWYIRYQHAELRRRGIDHDDDVSMGLAVSLRRERQRLVKAQADRAEYELRKEQAEMIPAELVEERIAAWANHVACHFSPFPEQVAPSLEGQPRGVIKQRLAESVRGALTALAVGGPPRRPETAAIAAKAQQLEPPPPTD